MTRRGTADDCGVDDCGRIRYEPLVRKVRQRTWLARVAFFELNRWTHDRELRVHASTAGGAALRAVREAKRERRSRRRTASIRVVISPVPHSAL